MSVVFGQGKLLRKRLMINVFLISVVSSFDMG